MPLEERYTNPTATTLNGGINNSTTTITVTDGSTFPPGGFRIKIESEIIFVTSRSTNTLTVLRGQEGTAAASHADTTAVQHVITAGAVNAIRKNILMDVGYLVDETAGADDDFFDDETFSGWTAVNSGGADVATVQEKHNALSILHPGGGSFQLNAWMKAKAPSAGDYIQCGFTMMPIQQYQLFGPIFADGATYNSGNQMFAGWSPGESCINLRGNTGYKTQDTFNIGLTFLANAPWPIMHIRLKWVGSGAWKAYQSLDGLQWIETNSITGVGSMTPTHAGFVISAYSSLFPCQVSLKYFRFSY